jgi:hypothetical protein
VIYLINLACVCLVLEVYNSTSFCVQYSRVNSKISNMRLEDIHTKFMQLNGNRIIYGERQRILLHLEATRIELRYFTFAVELQS